jgi:two-component system LytT family sensor kinase
MKMYNINKEIIFQLIFHVVVFIFYSFDRNQSGIETYKYANFLNYALTAAVINYIWLPIFYKRKNLLVFVSMVVFSIIVSALIEEFVLEKIFFSGQRADSIKMFWALIDIIPVVAILFGIKLGWDAVMKQIEVDKLEEVVKESQLQFLRSQINPHFLFNNLNNLYAYSLESSAKTPEIILELSGLLRYMLYECKEEYVSLSKEIDQLKNFVSLNELQIEDRGKVQFTVEGIDESYKIAPLIMMAFVENAFKHSLNSQSNDIEIEIEIKLHENGQLSFKCVNNYSITSNNSQLAKGIGLENVKQRLNLIYPEAHKLTIANDNKLYVVGLLIDLKKGP